MAARVQTVLRTLAAFFYCSHHRILGFTRRYFQHGGSSGQLTLGLYSLA